MTLVLRCFLGLLIAMPFLGVASAMAPFATTMVICSAGQTRTIWLDVAGRPTEAPPECADCVACLAPAVGPLPAMTGPPEMGLRSMTLRPVTPSRVTPATRWQARMPRGPPTGNDGAALLRAGKTGVLSALLFLRRDPAGAAEALTKGRS